MKWRGRKQSQNVIDIRNASTVKVIYVDYYYGTPSSTYNVTVSLFGICEYTTISGDLMRIGLETNPPSPKASDLAASIGETLDPEFNDINEIEDLPFPTEVQLAVLKSLMSRTNSGGKRPTIASPDGAVKEICTAFMRNR